MVFPGPLRSLSSTSNNSAEAKGFLRKGVSLNLAGTSVGVYDETKAKGTRMACSKLEGPIVAAETNVEKGRVECVIGDGLLRGGDSGRGTDRSITLSKEGMEDLAYGGFVFDHENKKFRWPFQEGFSSSLTWCLMSSESTLILAS
jgi:hypothetical protein